jgi:hypothetical protein
MRAVISTDDIQQHIERLWPVNRPKDQVVVDLIVEAAGLVANACERENAYIHDRINSINQLLRARLP